MKSGYTTTNPLMKMSTSPDMMSSRPQHEAPKAVSAAASSKANVKTAEADKYVKK